MSRILVLGGTGFIGKNFSELALKKGLEVTVLSKSGIHNELNNLNLEVIKVDLLDSIQLKKIHNHMLKTMEKNSCKIAKIYYCPHHPEEKCDCRKPNSGMIKQAMNDFEIKTQNAILIGDSETDIEAATKMKIKSIKIQTNGQLIDLIDDVKNIFFKELN